jgi:hypothetical protein
MSKPNKANRDHYTQRGRLTPDEAAREMVKQRQAASPKKVEGSQFGENVKSHGITGDKTGEPAAVRNAEQDAGEDEEETDEQEEQ